MDRMVNVLLTYPNDEIITIRQVKYEDLKKKKIKNLLDFEKYYNSHNLLDDYGANSMEYDENVKKDILYYLARKNGTIEWNPDYNSFDIYEIFKFPDRKEFVIRAYPGIGSTGGELLIGIISGLLVDGIKKVVDFFYKHNVKKSYKLMLKEFSVEKKLIDEIILRNDSWNYGFISNNNFKKKKYCEKHIMKNLNYKLVNNKWKR